MIKLYDVRNDKFKDIDYDQQKIIDDLYFNLSTILTKEQYKIVYPKMSDIEINNDILKIKKFISIYDKIIPLYNPYKKNIFLIKYKDVYSYVINKNYRILEHMIMKQLRLIITELLESQKDKEYIEKLKKNINFMNNYDIDILYITYQKIIYETNPIFKDLTHCERKSYLLYQYDEKDKKINPYYRKKELKYLKKIYKINEDVNICDIINNFDMDSKNLLFHQVFLTYNGAKSYIQYYSLLGSYLFNNYLRNDTFYRDIELENHIINFYKLISKSPSFDKNYLLFRYIDNDDYLISLKENDIFYEKSFISTTRNPFINFFNYNNDMYLITIQIPKNIEGIGLSIEAYSLFKYEMEIILNPSKLKLKKIIHKKEKPIFNHLNKLISEKIKKIYEFEYIGPNNIIPDLKKYISSIENNIPFYDFYDLNNVLFKNTLNEKIIFEFINDIPKLNNRRIFKTKINNKIYNFDVNFVIDNDIYKKFFFLENKNFLYKNYGPQIYLTHLNDKTGSIELLIEIKHIISVNYIHRYNGNKLILSDDLLLSFLSHLSYHFKIEQVIIHSKYESYALINKKTDYELYNINNMDNITSHFINLYIADTTYFSQDFINYIEKNEKRFNDNSITHITKYYLIDELMNKNPNDLIKQDIMDVLYKIQNKNKFKIIKNLYLFLHYNYPLLMVDLHKIMNDYIKNNNIKFIYPLTKPIYILKPLNYLFENKIINYIPTYNISIDNIYQNYNLETRQFFRLDENNIEL
jgi:hypothetical protein